MARPNPRQAARAYFDAVEAEKAIKAEKARAAETLREAYAKAGIDATIVDDVRIAIVPVTTTNVDVDTLADYSPSLLDRVAKVSVDLKKWHAAVKVGLVDPTLADKVVTEKFSDRIEVDRV